VRNLRGGQAAATASHGPSGRRVRRNHSARGDSVQRSAPAAAQLQELCAQSLHQLTQLFPLLVPRAREIYFAAGRGGRPPSTVPFDGRRLVLGRLYVLPAAADGQRRIGAAVGGAAHLVCHAGRSPGADARLETGSGSGGRLVCGQLRARGRRGSRCGASKIPSLVSIVEFSFFLWPFYWFFGLFLSGAVPERKTTFQLNFYEKNV